MHNQAYDNNRVIICGGCMDSMTMLFVAAGVIYGSYACVSFVASCFFKTFLVVPILKHAGVSHRVNAWKDSLKWGFYVGWEFLVAVTLLIPYLILFKCTYLLFKIDLAKISFWNSKEKRFLSSTPRSLFSWWVNEYFARYYPNKEFRQELMEEPLQ